MKESEAAFLKGAESRFPELKDRWDLYSILVMWDLHWKLLAVINCTTFSFQQRSYSWMPLSLRIPLLPLQHVMPDFKIWYTALRFLSSNMSALNFETVIYVIALYLKVRQELVMMSFQSWILSCKAGYSSYVSMSCYLGSLSLWVSVHSCQMTNLVMQGSILGYNYSNFFRNCYSLTIWASKSRATPDCQNSSSGSHIKVTDYAEPFESCRYRDECLQLIGFIAFVLYLAWLGPRRAAIKKRLGFELSVAGIKPYDSYIGQDVPEGDFNISQNFGTRIHNCSILLGLKVQYNHSISRTLFGRGRFI